MSKKSVTMGRKGIPVKAISYIALLTAVAAICNIFTVLVGIGNSFAISFSYIPCFISGAFFGPLAGFLTGMLGDLIGILIAPKGDFNPIIMLGSSFLGLIPGVVFFVARRISRKNFNYALPTIISFILVFLISTNINTLGLYLFYFRGAGKSLQAVYALRLPKQLIVWSSSLIICLILVKPVARLLKA